MSPLSPARARLASFAHAYAVAIRIRDATGRRQHVVRTSCHLQPYRISAEPPPDPDDLLVLVA